MTIDFFGSVLRNRASSNAFSPITKFYNELGRYPGNNKIWWVAKAQADDPDKNIVEGDFLPKVLDKVSSGNNRVPRGHYILNAFRKDRSAVSGVSGLPLEDKGLRPTACTFFSGRAWWSGDSKIFYSQIIDTKAKAGLCYQEADPTSEDISDLIASDGGVVPIPEASDIQRLVPLGNGVVVFAANGVWFVSGGDSAFTATDISMNKISSIGTKNPMAIVPVADTIFWWSEVGIHAIEQAAGQFGPIPGKFGNTNIAETTIQSFYNSISDDAKNKAKGIYDPKNNVIQWLYSEGSDPFRYNRVLLFDNTLQAFYPWSISDVYEGPEVVGVVLGTGSLTTQVQELVTTAFSVVSNNDGELVYSQRYSTTVENRPTNLTYLTAVGENLTFSRFTNSRYVDWETFDGTGAEYPSYLETGYELLEDAMRKKEAVRVFIHFRRTEDDPPDYPETSCKFLTKWDWTGNSNSNKWSREIEAYRPPTRRIATTTDLESGYPVVISNNKVRGSGKAVQFRFECSEAGKNFDLLGWSVAYAGNTEP